MNLLLACQQCQVDMKYAGGDAAGYSIFFLLVVILAVLAGVVTIMVKLIRRGAAALDPELSDDLVSTPLSPSHE